MRRARSPSILSTSRRIRVSTARISSSVTRPPCGRCGWGGRRAQRSASVPAPVLAGRREAELAGTGRRPRRSSRSARRSRADRGGAAARAPPPPAMFIASSSSWRPNTRQLITQVSISSTSRWSAGVEQHDADDAVVAERVEQAELQRERRAGRRRAPPPPPRCGGRVVVLNWLVLLMSWVTRARSTGGHRAELERHAEPRRNSSMSPRGARAGSARSRLAAYCAGARPVFGGEGDGLEIAGVGEAAHVVRRILRQLRHRHHRQRRAHARALDRVVVDEDQAVEADVQRLGDRAQVGRLVVPVGDEGGDVGPLQHHLGMVAEGRLGDRRVVLRAHREHDAALAQLLRIALQREMRLADARCPGRARCPRARRRRSTPPHSVLSRSSTRHLRDRPRAAASSRATRSP